MASSTASALEYTPELVAAEAASSRELANWRARGHRLATGHMTRQFEIGEWLLAGEEKWQKKAYREALGIFKCYNRKTLFNLASVAKRVPISLRKEKLSWNHHEAVAKLGPDDQKSWLERALENNWSSRELRALISEKHNPTQELNKPGFGSLRFSEEQLVRLTKLAELRNRSLPQLVFDLVVHCLEMPEVLAELATSKGLQGESHV